MFGMTAASANRGRTGLFLLCALALAACSSQNRLPQAAAAADTKPARPAVTAEPQQVAMRDLSGGAAPEFAVYSVLAPERPIHHGEFTWNPEGVPAAPLRIVVDIDAQMLYAYRGGIEIGRSAIIYGADDKPTPFGTFSILEKKADHISNLYGAPMPHMLRLTMDGIAIHGSESIDPWSATHGCIGLPEDFAALLFGEAGVGDRVLVTRGWMSETYAAVAIEDSPSV